MKQLFFAIIRLVFLLALLVGCQIGTSALSPQQLHTFIQEKRIQPLAVADVNGMATGILYKDNQVVGCFVVWAGNGIDERLRWDSAITSPRDRTLHPISAIYQSTFGNHVICMTINDAPIRQQASRVKLRFADGAELVATVQNNGDMILVRQGATSDRVELVLYDDDEQVLTRLAF